MRSWDDMRSVLAVRLDGLGDLLMTTPALRALKVQRPSRRLAVLASPAGAVAARELPFVDETIAFAAPWMQHGAPADAAAMTDLVARLRAARHDAAVIFTVCTQSPLPAATLCYLAGIPRRLAHVRENPYELVNDAVRDPDLDVRRGVRHEVERQLALVATTGATLADTTLLFPVREAARRSMLAKAIAAGADPERPWLVVHPGATAPSRRYPVPSFIAALRLLTAHGGDERAIVVAGGDEDRGDAERLRASTPGAVSLAGALTLPELAALLGHAVLLLCNNSGPAHLAAAVGTPVVDLYALTNPQHTPWRVPHATLSHDVPCRGCLSSSCPEGHHLCLAGVAPQEVADAVETLYAAHAERRGLRAAGAGVHSLRRLRSASAPLVMTRPRASCAMAPSSPPPPRKSTSRK